MALFASRLEPLELKIRLPPLLVVDPPLIWPPLRIQSPVVAVRVRLLPALLNVPFMFTVPPVRLKLLVNPVVETVPSRLRVPPVTRIAPALDHVPLVLNVEEASDTRSVPALVQVVPPPMLKLAPLTAW